MKRAWSGLVLTTWLLTACSEPTAISSSHTEQMEMIDVTFLTPVQLPTGETTLAVALTQADDIIEDADSVVFEVWVSGNSAQAEHIPANYVADGIYEAAYTFEEEGVYYMFAHATARGLHVMPKQQLIVGDASEDMTISDDYRGSMTEKQ